MMISQSIPLKAGASLLVLWIAAGSFMSCHGKSSGGSSLQAGPTVRSNSPVDQATNVPVNASMSVTLSERMDPTTLTAATLKVTFGPAATPVQGTVVYADSTAAFWPAAHLANNGTYTATITKEARSVHGIPLKADHVWTFTTGTTMEPGRPVALGRAGNFAILAKAAISTVPTSAVTGDLGISPAAASFITGFALTMHASNEYSTSSQVNGKVYASDYAVPVPINLTTSILDMELAFTDAAGRAPGVTELGAGNIGGRTLAPGVYKWGTGLLIPTDVTLNGNATDVWVFQVAKELTVSSAAKVVLTGGARSKNVFWQVAGLVDIGTTAQFNGVILTATAITLRNGASVNGRLLAQTAVSIDGNAVVEPAQ